MICDEDGAEPKWESELKRTFIDLDGPALFRVDWKRIGRFITKLNDMYALICVKRQAALRDQADRCRDSEFLEILDTCHLHFQGDAIIHEQQLFFLVERQT